MADDLLGTKNEKTWTTGGEESWIGRRGERTPIKTHKQTSIQFELAVRWQTSVLSLLARVFGTDAPIYERFDSATERGYANDWTAFQARHAIFLAAKDEFEGGYIFDVRNLVHAHVFSGEHEQATHLLDGQWKTPAAVIAGTVLETTLREMCDQHPNLAPKQSANAMIQGLAKEGVINQMRADQLRAWTKTRNSAAHGKPDEFNDNDVTRMIDGIRDFIANHMS